MTRSRLSLLAMLPLALVALSAHAQQPDYAKSGVYIGLALGGGIEKFDDSGLVIKFDDGVVGGATLGVRLHPNLAAEVQFEIGTFDADLGPTDFVTNIYMYTANAKGYLLTGRVQPYAMVGVGGMSAKAEFGVGSASASDTGFAARFGAGVDVWLNDSISLGAAGSYVLPTGGVNGLDYVSLAVTAQYRF